MPRESHSSPALPCHPLTSRLLSFGQLLAVALICSPALRSQDFADPADNISRKAAVAKSEELTGSIREVTSKKPGWYGVVIDHGGGKATHMVVSPATKFWENYKPLDTAKALPKIAIGQKVRFIHKQDMDLALHVIWASDVMFVPK